MRLIPLEFSLCHRLSPKPYLNGDRGKTESSLSAGIPIKSGCRRKPFNRF
ncbi:hypothetical protein GMO_22660 [Gluconobacter morbifer G707]|uniref:Uncharacterized protein n=1 Tax=Gluconobacter morbifer G707 TaxID=1088869 RepID=G6XLL7_9PROT|nr:hypothetical protein GMO_22660 [Gluconobacter morbifer G707]